MDLSVERSEERGLWIRGLGTKRVCKPSCGKPSGFAVFVPGDVLPSLCNLPESSGASASWSPGMTPPPPSSRKASVSLSSSSCRRVFVELRGPRSSGWCIARAGGGGGNPLDSTFEARDSLFWTCASPLAPAARAPPATDISCQVPLSSQARTSRCRRNSLR